MRFQFKVFVMSACLWLPIVAGAYAAERTLAVQGNGAVEHAPDQAKLRLQFVARDAQVSLAKNKVDEQTQAFTEFVLSKQISKQNINNALMQVQALYPTTEQPALSFQVAREVVLTLADLTSYPEILAFAASLGHVDIQPVDLFHSNGAKLYQQALVQAMADAKVKAGVLAAQSGAKVGKVLKVTELNTGVPMMTKMAAFSASSVETGMQSIRAELAVEFQLVEP